MRSKEMTDALRDESMNRLLPRFAALVLLSIAVATLLVYVAFDRLFGDPLQDIARRQASAQIFLLSQYVDQAPADEWLARLNKVREVSEARLDIVPLAEAQAAVSAGQRDALLRGEVIIDVPGKRFYRRVDRTGNAYIGSEADAIVASRLPIDVGLALRMEAVRFVIVALALLIPIGLWSRAHRRGLQHLSAVADQFGQGRLDVRARIAPRASIAPLAQRINHMADRIGALLTAQRNLLHSVSHELRTPISRLEFALELQRDALDAATRERHWNGMAGDLAELNALVTELLGMTQLRGQHGIHNARFALAPALRACVAALAPLAPGLRLDCEVDAALGDIDAEQRLLERAVGNLLRNAVRYARSQVTLSARRLASGGIEIAVEDDGPGIPVDERERVFEPFYRLDRSRDRATGGFGLGLAIVREAVALHRGSVSITDAALGGARVVIVLGGASGGVNPA